MATTLFRVCDVPEVRQELVRWTAANVGCGLRGSGAVQVNGFTDSLTMRSSSGAEQFSAPDRMMWLARTTGQEWPVQVGVVRRGPGARTWGRSLRPSSSARAFSDRRR